MLSFYNCLSYFLIQFIDENIYLFWTCTFQVAQINRIDFIPSKRKIFWFTLLVPPPGWNKNRKTCCTTRTPFQHCFRYGMDEKRLEKVPKSVKPIYSRDARVEESNIRVHLWTFVDDKLRNYLIVFLLLYGA